MIWLRHVSYWHRSILTLIVVFIGAVAGSMLDERTGQPASETTSYIGAGIGLALAIWIFFLSAPTPGVSSFGDPFEDMDPYSHVSTAELKRRHSELNRVFHMLTEEQRKEHDMILHALLMRGERP